jgi:ABC-type glycerol-3-phosphate transport system substrate-binding protein
MIFLALMGSSCAGPAKAAATLWTDSPEMALYAELFNAENGRYRVEVSYRERLARDFVAAKSKPSMIVGHWIRGAAVRPNLRSLDSLFTELRLNARAFYADFLTQGKVDGRQLFIPVSFNLPAVAFNEEAGKDFESGFFIGLDEMEAAGKAYNRDKGGSFVKMGFSPRFEPEFLYLLASLDDAAFQEGKPLAYDRRGLTVAVERARAWVANANGSAAAEDDFAFKYLYDPGYRSAASGRVLFTYLSSDALLGMPEQKQEGLSFRWILHEGKVPANDDEVYLALSRKGTGRPAAEAFAAWFFDPGEQKRILEDAKDMRTLETGFGIAGGFSSLREVNEKAFPAYYPGLVGHMPPDGPFMVSKPLPENWPILKREIVLPFLAAACSEPPGAPLPRKGELEERISTWLRENPEGK